jgi:2-C-methyl-D-erythritol 2,4-cyclodiphosphate synthase
VNLRVGIGYDVHPFAAGRPLVLGGVEVPSPRGLEGHSDADAACHAIADAILGALALGDLGAHFPDTDPAWKDAKSLGLLARVTALAAERGWRVGNADVTIVTEAPKLAPHAGGMREELARALGVTKDEVSVKATRNEGLGAVGRGEGLLALAVVTVIAKESA